MTIKTLSSIAVLALLLTGCVTSPSTGNIEAFGVATEKVTTTIDGAISDYNHANINNRIVAMAQLDKKYVASDFAPIRQLIVRDAARNQLTLYKANKALSEYAQALTSVAKAGSDNDLSEATVKLSNALVSLNEQYKMLSDTNSEPLGESESKKLSTILTKLSSLYIKKKRVNALKEIIISADPAVQTVAGIINQQLINGVIEGRLYTMRGRELAGYFADYNAKAAVLSFVEKKQMLDTIYEKYLEVETSTASIRQARKALVAVMDAHTILRIELEAGRYESSAVTQALEKIKVLDTQSDRLMSLIQNCETEIAADEEKGIICKYP